MVDRRQDQLDGARVAAVHRRLRDTGLGSHARQRHVLEAVADEDLGRRSEDRAVDIGVERAAGSAGRRGLVDVHLRSVSISATVSFETVGIETTGDVQ